MGPAPVRLSVVPPSLNGEKVHKQNLICASLQTFCGTTTRTVLLDDIIDVEDEEDLQDHLEIHFQKPSNNGGEIECIRYISKGKALRAFFCEDTQDV